MAAAADAAPLVALNDAVQQLHSVIEPHYFRPPFDDGERESFFRATLAAADNFLWLAESAMTPIGYAWCERQSQPKTPFTFERTQLYVHHICVEPSTRERGVGTALMTHIEEQARRLACSQIRLDTWIANAGARDFFAKRGYQALNVISAKLLP